jgi:Ca2+/Na+ antiporter
MPFESFWNIDLAVLVGASLALFFSAFMAPHHLISRLEGFIFLVIYILYTISLFSFSVLR